MPPKKNAKPKANWSAQQECSSYGHEDDEDDVASQDLSNESQEEQKFKNSKWTKVIHINKDEAQMIRVCSLQIDMDSLEDLPRYLLKKPKKPWGMIFDPDEFEEANEELTMEEWQLS